MGKVTLRPFHYYLGTLESLEEAGLLTDDIPTERTTHYLWVRLYLEGTKSPIPHRRVMGDFHDLPLSDLEHIYRELRRWITRARPLSRERLS